LGRGAFIKKNSLEFTKKHRCLCKPPSCHFSSAETCAYLRDILPPKGAGKSELHIIPYTQRGDTAQAMGHFETFTPTQALMNYLITSAKNICSDHAIIPILLAFSFMM